MYPKISIDQIVDSVMEIQHSQIQQVMQNQITSPSPSTTYYPTLSEMPTKQGIKHDLGKPDLSYISLTLLEEVAKVREFGAKKYARNNWLKGFKYTRSIAAALRHIMAFNTGENLDSESGLSHVAHAICCLEHLLNDIKNHPENDNRNE